MKCLRCAKQATYHITEVLPEDRFDEVHLCEDCAKKYLAQPHDPPAPADAAGPSAEALAGPTCDACGLSYLEFRNHGRFGCGHDYDAFKGELLPLLESIHGEVRHAGKAPRRPPRSPGGRAELTTLRRRLQQLVTEENYEEAARVRDRIRELENE
jgi:protein arginine kinase activator